MDEWPISCPFEFVDKEQPQSQFHDKIGQVHREDLIGWEAASNSALKGRLLEVVHGYKNDNKRMPRTLIVFEWRLEPSTSRGRVKNVKIIVAFHAIGTRNGVELDGSLEDWDPVPIQWAPEKPILSHFSIFSVSQTVQKALGAVVGYENFINIAPKITKETVQTVERIDYRYITGSPTYVAKNSGTRNAVQWELRENCSLKSGVQYYVRTAVLLRRKAFDMGKFIVSIQAEANMSRSKYLIKSILKAMRIRPVDCPAAFDPTVEPGTSRGEDGDDDVAARNTTRDWRNMDNLNLEEVLVKDWELTSYEVAKLQ
ncbi:hypothetical protein GGR58DRAFT_490679 [Xylaria digitata]|nr:hypothetical protein GGR58DRAFT_490679 [Xylaria digitata]